MANLARISAAMPAGILILVAAAVFTDAALPDYIKVCQAKDPNITSCIVDSVNSLRSKLTEGIPELDVPPLEPLILDQVELRTGPTNAHIESKITDLKVWGPAGFVIKEFRPNIAKNKFTFRLLLPQLYFTGMYDMDMRILLVNIHGKGPLTGNFTNYHIDIAMKGRKVDQEGAEYLKFDKMKIKMHVGQSQLHLENLFNGDPVLGRAANELIRDNSDLFIGEIKPLLENALAEKFTEIANKITLRFTYKELFP